MLEWIEKLINWLFKLPDKEDTRKSLFVCCGNCDHYDAGNYPRTGKEPKTDKKGFCPNIYWPYNINWVSNTWFCRDKFAVATRFIDTHKPNWEGRKDQKGIVEELLNRGIKKQSAMIGDSPVKE